MGRPKIDITNTQGKLPFDDPSFRGLAAKIKSGIFRMPDLAPELKDLLIKILTVNPKSRITIDGIKRHPAFRIGLPPTYVIPSPFSVPKLEHPIDITTLNPSVIEFIHRIGYSDDDEELRKDLSSTESNMTKSLCVLLTHRVSVHTLPWPSSFRRSGSCSREPSSPDLQQLASGDLGAEEDIALDFDIEPFVYMPDAATVGGGSVGLIDSFRVFSFAERSSLYPESFSPMTASFPAKILIDEVKLPAEVVAAELQRFFSQMEFEWLFPNDYCLLARDEAIVVMVRIEPVLQSDVCVVVQRLQGATERLKPIADQIGNMLENVSY